MLRIFVKLIAVEYVLRKPRPRSLVFILLYNLTFRPPRIGVEIREISTKLFVWGVRGDTTPAPPFL